MTILWISAIVLFLIAEAATAGLVTIWFAVGALAALLAALFGAPIWLQLVWFFAISIAAFAVTRPLAKKYLNSKVQPTNADRLIGKKCIVTEPIEPLTGKGAVSIDGKVWTARSAEEQPLPQGSAVVVLRIEGVKLIVSPAGSPAETDTIS